MWWGGGVQGLAGLVRHVSWAHGHAYVPACVCDVMACDSQEYVSPTLGPVSDGTGALFGARHCPVAVLLPGSTADLPPGVPHVASSLAGAVRAVMAEASVSSGPAPFPVKHNEGTHLVGYIDPVLRALAEGEPLSPDLVAMLANMPTDQVGLYRAAVSSKGQYMGDVLAAASDALVTELVQRVQRAAKGPTPTPVSVLLLGGGSDACVVRAVATRVLAALEEQERVGAGPVLRFTVVDVIAVAASEWSSMPVNILVSHVQGDLYETDAGEHDVVVGLGSLFSPTTKACQRFVDAAARGRASGGAFFFIQEAKMGASKAFPYGCAPGVEAAATAFGDSVEPLATIHGFRVLRCTQGPSGPSRAARAAAAALEVGGGSCAPSGPSLCGTVYLVSCHFDDELQGVYVGSTMTTLASRGGAHGQNWTCVTQPAESGFTYSAVAIAEVRTASAYRHTTRFLIQLLETAAIRAAAAAGGFIVHNKRMIGTSSSTGFTMSHEECVRGGAWG